MTTKTSNTKVRAAATAAVQEAVMQAIKEAIPQLILKSNNPESTRERL